MVKLVSVKWVLLELMETGGLGRERMKGQGLQRFWLLVAMWSPTVWRSSCAVLRLLFLLFSCSVVSDSLQPHGLKPARLLCPWDFPGRNTGLGCHALLQEIFLTQGSNPCLLHWEAGSLPLSHQGSPLYSSTESNSWQQNLGTDPTPRELV